MAEIELTHAEPARVIRGGLVVLHESKGITEAVQGMVAGLAAEGWLVVVPHLYPDGTTDVSTLSGDSVLAAADAAFTWLAERGVAADRTGVIGFELGGSAALVVAASRDVGAAVSVAGPGILEPVSDTLPALVDVAGDLRCPWLGLYPEESGVTEEEVNKLRDAATAAPVASDVVRFSGNDGLYDAWQRALNWLDAHMR